MKNKTYGRGLSTHECAYINYAIAHAQNLRLAEADDRTFKYKTLQDTFDNTTDTQVAICYQLKYTYV